MGIFDPHECRVAAEYLRQGAADEAARVLLQCRYPHHKAVVELKLQACQVLVQQAKALFDDHQLQAALELIELAGKCRPLAGEDQKLYLEICSAWEKQNRKHQWKQKHLDQAEQLLQQGRLHTADEVIKLLDSSTSVGLVRQELQLKQCQLERYLEQCQEALQRKDLQAAKRFLKKAQEVCPDDPRVLKLLHEIAAQEPKKLEETTSEEKFQQKGESAVFRSSRPEPFRGRFVLDRRNLVLLDAQVCIGTPRGKGVQIPVLGPLRGRHAILYLDGPGWSVVPCRNARGQACPVQINSNQISAPCTLKDGDRIQFGSSRCRWRFRLPVPHSQTAVLELDLNLETTVAVGSVRISQVVLFQDQLVLAPRPPAHLIVPELPCQQLKLTLSPQGIKFEVQGGTAWWECRQELQDQQSRATWPPACLNVESELDEAARLGMIAAGRGDQGLMSLPFDPA